MGDFKLKTCPNCKANLNAQHQLCEYCGYQFERKAFKSEEKIINSSQKQDKIEVDNEFIISFAKEWGIEKNNYSYLMQEEGELIKIVGAAGVSELTAVAFKLDQKHIEQFLNWKGDSSIAEAIKYWEKDIEGEDFFVDWDCFEIDIDVVSESGKEYEIIHKEFDSDKLTLEDKMKTELFSQVSNCEKYNYVMVTDEFRKGEKFEEIFRIKTSSVYSNFNNKIEIDGEEHYFYELKTDQWQVKDIDYSFYKISDSVEYIGDEDEFIGHLKILKGEL